jgi:hypothetical protein
MIVHQLRMQKLNKPPSPIAMLVKEGVPLFGYSAAHERVAGTHPQDCTRKLA